MENYKDELSRKLSEVMCENRADDGIHIAELSDVNLKMMVSRFTQKNEEFIEFAFRLSNGAVLRKLDKVSRSQKSNLYKDLKRMGSYPGDGDLFDINSLIGQTFKIRVENVTRGDVQYSNVVEIIAPVLKRDKKTTITPPKPPQKKPTDPIPRPIKRVPREEEYTVADDEEVDASELFDQDEYNF